MNTSLCVRDATECLLEKNPEPPRTTGRNNPPGSAETERAMSRGACGWGSLVPEPSSTNSSPKWATCADEP